jgi:hypothetical protein
MRLAHIALMALLLPAPLLAQGMGGMGGRGGGMGRVGQSRGLPKFATAKELERFNAADALLNDQRKLKLTEAQVTQLTSLRATLFERNSDLLVRYDSVRKNYNPPVALTDPRGPASEGAMPSPAEMAVLREQMLLMMAVADQLMERRPDNVAACLALVDDSQKERATKVLTEQTEELRKQVPERPKGPGAGPRR